MLGSEEWEVDILDDRWCLLWCFGGKGANLTDLTMGLGCGGKACLGGHPRYPAHSCQCLGGDHCRWQGCQKLLWYGYI